MFSSLEVRNRPMFLIITCADLLGQLSPATTLLYSYLSKLARASRPWTISKIAASPMNSDFENGSINIQKMFTIPQTSLRLKSSGSKLKFLATHTKFLENATGKTEVVLIIEFMTSITLKFILTYCRKYLLVPVILPKMCINQSIIYRSLIGAFRIWLMILVRVGPSSS